MAHKLRVGELCRFLVHRERHDRCDLSGKSGASRTDNVFSRGLARFSIELSGADILPAHHAMIDNIERAWTVLLRPGDLAEWHAITQAIVIKAERIGVTVGDKRK